MDCRDPEAMDGNIILTRGFLHPCFVDSGNPCRNDGDVACVDTYGIMVKFFPNRIDDISTFHFQHFSVLQEQSAMKVCTDAVLFGAMAPVNRGDRVLDIGAGTGILSLMAAQLGAAQVTAVELTQQGHEEARINFKNSPWAVRLEAVHQAIQDFSSTAGREYDLVICNPPFFENHSKTTNSLRKIARHNDQLSFADLIKSADQLLSSQGLFYLLLPVHAVEKFAAAALDAGFYLIHQTDFRGYTRNEANVSALTFSRTVTVFATNLMTIYESHRVYTKDSERYLSPFLLRFTKN
jgi:tRNA1Val (adenine37-N6)-methyltransferase